MTNLSSLSKTRGGAYAAIGLISAGLATVLLDAPMLVSAVATVLALAAAVFTAIYSARTSDFVARATAVAQDAERGNFEVRLTRVGENGDLLVLAQNINGLMDRTEAYVRESAASLNYVSQNKYFRKIDTRGMCGMMRIASESTNQAVTAIAAKVSDFYKVTNDFEGAMGKIATSIGDASKQLQSNARQMEQSATTSAERSVSVSAAATQATANVQTVAAAAEEMSA